MLSRALRECGEDIRRGDFKSAFAGRVETKREAFAVFEEDAKQGMIGKGMLRFQAILLYGSLSKARRDVHNDTATAHGGSETRERPRQLEGEV